MFRIELNKNMVGYTDASRHAAVLKRHINNEIRQKKKLDDYNENPTKCKMCDGFLSYGQSKSNLTYCCVGCANRNRKHTESTKIKIGNSLKLQHVDAVVSVCRICKCEFCSITRRKKNLCWTPECIKEAKKQASEKSIKLLKDRGHVFTWRARTKDPSYPEQYFIKVFNNSNIEFIRELHVHKWFIDFALEKYKIAVEIDGQQHQWSDRIESDKLKDKYLTDNGWKVYRIKWYNPVTDLSRNKLYSQIEGLFLLLGIEFKKE